MDRGIARRCPSNTIVVVVLVADSAVVVVVVDNEEVEVVLVAGLAVVVVAVVVADYAVDYQWLLLPPHPVPVVPSIEMRHHYFRRKVPVL